MKLTILFWVYKSRVNKKGNAPLVLRLSYGTQRKQHYTGVSIPVEKWDAAKSKAKGKDDQASNINTYIRNVSNRIMEIYNEMIRTGDVYLDHLVDKMLGKDENNMTLIQLVNYHSSEMRKRIGIDYTIGTLKKYQVTKGKLERFLSSQYKKTDIRLKDLDRKFIADFDIFMKIVDKNDQNTTTKHCKNLKAIINLAVANDWMEKSPFSSFRCPYKVKPKVFLTSDELKTLQGKTFKIDRLNLVKDVFLFQCYTGLSFTDMAKLTGADVTSGIDKGRWIIIQRTKTGVRSAIPLLPPALEIILKYNPEYSTRLSEMLLPMYSIQKFNSYLQEIADFCGIPKNLSSHAGRRTFATTVALANGVSIETISKILGHSTTKITHQYAVVTDLKVAEEMKKVII